MPSYSYLCQSCEHKFDRIFKIADRKTPEGDPCPSCNKAESVIHTVTGSPMICDPNRLGDVSKIPGGFKDVLRKIHDRTPRSNLNLKFNG